MAIRFAKIVTQSTLPFQTETAPAYAQAQSSAAIEAFLLAVQAKLDAVDVECSDVIAHARRLASWWDQAKTDLRMTLITATKAACAAITTGYRQRSRRLHEQLNEVLGGVQLTSVETATRAAQDPTTTCETSLTTSGVCICPTGHTERILGARAAAARFSVSQCLATAKRKQLLRSHAFSRTATTKSFYARTPTKFSNNVMYNLGGKARDKPRRSADDMADGWRDTVQHDDAAPEVVTAFLRTLGVPPAAPSESTTDRPINEKEVVLAIQKSARGKSHGPDELGNDFYKDYAKTICPILADFFNCWYDAGVAPA